MNRAFDLETTDWMDDVANDLAEFLADADNAYRPAVTIAPPPAANDNTPRYSDEPRALVWSDRYRTVW